MKFSYKEMISKPFPVDIYTSNYQTEAPRDLQKLLGRQRTNITLNITERSQSFGEWGKSSCLQNSADIGREEEVRGTWLMLVSQPFLGCVPLLTTASGLTVLASLLH